MFNTFQIASLKREVRKLREVLGDLADDDDKLERQVMEPRNDNRELELSNAKLDGKNSELRANKQALIDKLFEAGRENVALKAKLENFDHTKPERDENGRFVGKSKTAPTPKRVATVFVAGLHWDKQNLPGLHNYNEAQKLAKKAGGRLATKEEFEKLRELPHVWGEEKKGMWFADSEADLKNPDKSLFLPAAGNRRVDGSVVSRGVYGTYWSSTAHNASNGFYLDFTNVNLSPVYALYYAFGFSVRCVRA